METTQAPGGYFVQCTDEALDQESALLESARTSICHKIQVAAAVKPHMHGTSEGGIPDRIRIYGQGASALVWVSSDVRVLTIVQLRREEESPMEPVEFSLEEDE